MADRNIIPGGSEHDLQCACVDWFRYQYRAYWRRLFAVPNGGERNRIVAARMKAEGVVPGVSDLILLVRRGDYGALLIEMKTASGKQSPEQKAWEGDVTEDGGYRYVVCRSLNDFIRQVRDYMALEGNRRKNTTNHGQ